MTKKKFKGSTFESFLEDEGLLEEAEAIAIKKVIAYQLTSKIKKDHISKTEMAKMMGTSRSALDRLLDPKNTSVTLSTLVKAAHFVGKRLHISFA